MDDKTGRRVALVLAGVLCLAGYVLAVNVATTQAVAIHYGYHPLLGKPLFGKFYSPIAWYRWQQQYLATSRLFFLKVYVYYLLAMGAGFLAYVLAMGFITRSSRTHATAHGTAHFANTEKEIRAMSLLPPKGADGAGVYVGAWLDPKGQVRYLRHDGPEHVGVIAPTRSGKGVSLVNPTLLSWPASAVIADMKGELWWITAGCRARAGHRVHRYDPTLPEGSISINPLAEIRLGTVYEVGDAQNIALLLTDPTGVPLTGSAAHFQSTARMFLTGCILYLLHQQRDATQPASLYDIASALSDPARKADDLYDAMLVNEFAPPGLYGDTKTHPIIASAARDQKNRPEEERGSVLSTAMSYLELYRDPIIRRNTSRSDLRISDLVNGDTPVSLYLMASAEQKDRVRPLMRLILNQMMRVLLRPKLKYEKGQAVPPHKHRLLMMIDEFPAFGRLEVFQESLAYIAGYGIKAYLIMQDIAQLWAAYGRDETIISNLHIRIAFAPNKPETAEWLSRMTGTTTIVKEHISTSGRRFGALLQNVSRDFQEQSRPLMTPDEIMRLKAPQKSQDGSRITEAGQILVFVAGHAPILGTHSLYFLDPVFLARSLLPPPDGSSNALKADASPDLKPPPSAPSAVEPFQLPPAGHPTSASAAPPAGSSRSSQLLDLDEIKARGRAAGLQWREQLHQKQAQSGQRG